MKVEINGRDVEKRAQSACPPRIREEFSFAKIKYFPIQNATYFKKFENVQLYLRAKKKASSSGYPIAPNIPATPRCCL
jgi:hypothetical protein